MDKMRKKKTLVLSAAIASMLLPPLTMNAQYDEHKYGLQPWFKSSLMRREGSTVGGDINAQGFGATNGNITGQTFGDDAPLGSGLFVLLAAGAGYSTMKSRKKQNKQNRKEK
jgi:hypothetical protein